MGKQLGIIVAFIVLSAVAHCQPVPPSYTDIIKTFCSNYAPSDDPENYTSFSKKKDGWYVQQVNLTRSGKLIEEVLFYSYQENKFLDLSDHYGKPSDIEMEKQLKKFLNDAGASEWYCFEHIPYYGYSGWDADMIRDFGHAQELPDSIYDGLARAYDNDAVTYLWFQTGGLYTGTDTLKRKLERLEYPSLQRIEKVKAALSNSIIQFKKLTDRNPLYKTIIGNATLKLFNEYLHAYHQLMLCGKDSMAREYLVNATLPDPYLQQAKNYLNSCEPNAVLFTYGDNDTYQLWYLQEKFNFRKDILVINYSLLGMPVYIDMFKRKQLLTLSIPDSFLKSQRSDLALFSENSDVKDTGSAVPMNRLLQIIYTGKYPVQAADDTRYSGYPYSKAVLPALQKKLQTNQPSEKVNIRIKLKKYYFINDIALFDIISNNINNRPIYFTTPDETGFDQYLFQKGIVYKLTTETVGSSKQRKKELIELQGFINDKYQPVLSNNAGIESFDGDNTFFAAAQKILDYYRSAGDTTKLRYWLNRVMNTTGDIKDCQLRAAWYLGYYLMETGDADRGLKIFDQYAQWLHRAYTAPSSITGFYSYEKYSSKLTQLKDLLETKKLQSTLINDLLKSNQP